MMERKLAWFPFTTAQVEIALGLAGLGATAASLLEVPGPTVALGTAGFLLLTFLVGLLAAASGNRVARVHLDGALHGRGYADLFRHAHRSLLLIHLDDDAPHDELLGLYRRLLERGIEIRRLIFVRPDHRQAGVRWIREFGPHELLRQRFVETASGNPLPLSFAVVDEDAVLIAVPGYHPTETETFGDGLVLRHLIELRHPTITRAFLEAYESAWRRGTRLEDDCLA
ncbi:MAG: hypothetical protein ACE37K_11595 [Planctomycetota bacterium]